MAPESLGAAGFNLSATHCADLKPENFLLKNRTGSIEKDNLRAVDFGLSSIHRDGMICKQIVGSGESFASTHLHGLDCLTANRADCTTAESCLPNCLQRTTWHPRY